MSQVSIGTYSTVTTNDSIAIGQSDPNAIPQSFDSVLQQAGNSYREQESTHHSTDRQRQENQGQQTANSRSSVATDDQNKTTSEDESVTNNDDQDTLENQGEESSASTDQTAASSEDKPADQEDKNTEEDQEQDNLSLSAIVLTTELNPDETNKLDDEINTVRTLSDEIAATDSQTNTEQSKGVLLPSNITDTEHAIQVAHNKSKNDQNANATPAVDDTATDTKEIETNSIEQGTALPAIVGNGPEETQKQKSTQQTKPQKNKVESTNNLQQLTPDSSGVSNLQKPTDQQDDDSSPQKNKHDRNSKNRNPVGTIATDLSATVETALAAALESTTTENDLTVTKKSDAGQIKAVNQSESRASEIGNSRIHSSLTSRAAQESNAPKDSISDGDRLRFIQRVSKAFQTAHHRDGVVKLRLSPPELGSLAMEVSVKEGVLTAKIETDTSTARNLILDNLNTLRDRLDEQGIKVEKFDVDVQHRPPNEMPEQQEQKDNNHQNDRANSNLGESETNSNEGETKTMADTDLESGQLNIII